MGPAISIPPRRRHGSRTPTRSSGLLSRSLAMVDEGVPRGVATALVLAAAQELLDCLRVARGEHLARDGEGEPGAGQAREILLAKIAAPGGGSIGTEPATAREHAGGGELAGLAFGLDRLERIA